ncbi:MAG: hypothetical protein DRR19_04810, partial [Candidatus Parabeggiatoa sp. nov. 1]
MKKIAYLLMGCALHLSIAQTASATAELTFTQLKPFYNVGECIIVNLQENLQAASRFQRVDLWVAIEPPSQQWLFMTPLAFDPFSLTGEPFRTSLETTKKVHRILDFEVLPGLGGDYTFYALYVEEGKNPLTDNFPVFRSNVAVMATTLSNRALPTDAPSNCDTPHVEPEPTPDVPTASKPAAPTHLAAVAGNSQITLSWQAVAEAVAYQLYWDQAGGGDGILPVVGATSVQHTGLHNGVNYTYWVTAMNAANLESASSSAVVATPAAPVFPPATPVNLAANPDNGQIVLTWQPVSGADAYLVYWEAAGGSGHSISTKTPAYVHTGLTNGTTYYYRVTAINHTTRLESASSPVISAAPCCDAITPPTTVAGEIFRDTLTDGSAGPEMVVIPAGSFRMGDIQGGGESDEQPVHSVSVESFAMGSYEVTFAEYDHFAEATGREKPSDSGWGRGNRPVINVSGDDATDYAAWLSEQTGHQYRLPTEAEWEYAARAGTETARYWGNNPDDACAYANVHDNTSKEVNGYSWTHHDCTDGYAKTAPVGHFQPNAFGLFDVLGNVWEWTCSEYESSYQGAEQRCVSTD